MADGKYLEDKYNGWAYVIFEHSPLPFLFMLKPDFRHVSVIVKKRGQYIALNPSQSVIDIEPLDAEEFSEDKLLNELNPNVTVVKVMMRKHKVRSPFMWFSCVEVVKRVIGVRDRSIWTPYQLYKHLMSGGHLEFTPKDQ